MMRGHEDTPLPHISEGKKSYGPKKYIQGARVLGRSSESSLTTYFRGVLGGVARAHLHTMKSLLLEKLFYGMWAD